MNNNQLEFSIKAVDEASAQLNKVAASLKELQDKSLAAASTLDKAGTSSAKAGNSTESMAVSVFKGVAAWDALKKAGELAFDFLKGSVGEALEAAETMAQVKTNVENAGLSYEKLAPALEAAGHAAIKLGFSDDEAKDSLGRLTLATGDFGKAQQLNNLAMDLARSKHIGLNEATTVLQQVLAGNTKVLKAYGLSFSETASTAEILNAVQGKVKGSAEAFGESAAGNIAQVKAQWAEMKENVGNELLPVLQKLFKAFEDNLPAIEKALKGFIDFVVKAITGILDLVSKVSAVFNGAAESLAVLSGQQDAYARSNAKLGDGLTNTIAQWNKLHANAQITASDFQQMEFSQQKAIISAVKHAEETGKLTVAIKAGSSSFNNFTTDTAKSATAAAAAAKAYQDAVTKLTDSVKKMRSDGKQALAELADASKDKLGALDGDIRKIQQSINDLNAEFARTQGSELAQVADTIVASQNKVADLQKQILAAKTEDQRVELIKQLEAEQKNLDTSTDFQKDHADAIAEAKRRAGLTDIQRTIEDYNTRKQLETAQYNDKIMNLQNELMAKQAERDAEQKLYTDKVAVINKILTEANVLFKTLSDERLKTTKEEVDAEIAYFNALTEAINRAKAASSSTLGLSGAGVPNLPRRAKGGPVSPYSSYIVGEMGPELFTPGTGGGITSNDKLGTGGGVVNVNINGGTYLNEKAANIMANLIMNQLKRTARIGV